MELSEQFWWYTSRSAGLVAWGLLTLSVLWGLLASTRLRAKMIPGHWVLDVHRFLGGLAVTFTAVHVLALVPDSYVEFGPRELLVPGASSWQPEPVVWGVVGLYLLMAVEITSLLMQRLPRRLWRWIHMLSFGLFVVATVHSIKAGTDAGRVAVRWAGIVAVQLVLFLVIARLMTSRRLRSSTGPEPAGNPGRRQPDLVPVPVQVPAGATSAHRVPVASAASPFAGSPPAGGGDRAACIAAAKAALAEKRAAAAATD